MDRRNFIKCVGAGASLMVPGMAWAAGKSKPNIVFILVDDLGYMDIGAYGSSFYETPNVDKLVKNPDLIRELAA